MGGWGWAGADWGGVDWSEAVKGGMMQGGLGCGVEWDGRAGVRVAWWRVW